MDLRSCAAWAAVALLGCSAQRPHAGPADAVQPQLCPGHGAGLTIGVTHTSDGAEVVYASPQPGALEALYGELMRNAAQSSARASGGSPLPTIAPMPPVTQRIERGSSVLTVRYHAIDPADASRVQQLVGWDAARQQQGACPSLRVAADAEPDPLADPNMPQVEARFWTPTVTGVRMDPALLARCRLTTLGDFVAVDLLDRRARLYPLLDRVTQCLTTGPLAQGTVVVEGRDDRVNDDWARQHGRSRAEVFAEMLQSMGVAQGQITTRRSSGARGDTDARGWAWYRRVDVSLGP